MRAWLAAIGLVLASLGCAGEPPPSLVMITIDTLRADHVGCYGYFRDTTPTLDALAREGVLFEQAIAPMATTLPSHTSLMTSTYPARHGVRGNFYGYRQAVPVDPGGLQTLAQLLQQAGYSTAAFVSVFHLRPETGIVAGFATYDGVPGSKKHPSRGPLSRRADLTTARAVEWLEGRPPRPFFLWVHYFDPHAPYDPPPEYARRFHGDARLGAFLRRLRIPRGELAWAPRVHDRYDGEVRFTDDQLAVLLGALRRLGLYDDAAVLVTADHGEGLGQHAVTEHGVLWDEQLRVPLVLKLPGGARAGERVPDLVSLIDVVPTLVAALDLPVPTGQFDGIDAFSTKRRYALAERERSTKRFGADVSLTLTGERWKYHYHTLELDTLFDLQADPIETVDVLAQHAEVGAAMRQEILRLVEVNREKGAALGTREAPPSPELRDALEALGYVE